MEAPTINIAKIFFNNVKKDSKKTALLFNDNIINYSELSKIVYKISSEIEIAKSTHMAVLLDNSIEFVGLLIAAAKVGVTLVPFDKTTPKKQLEKLYIKININYQYSDKGIETINSYCGIKNSLTNDLPYIVVSTSGSISEPKPIILTQNIKLKRIKIAQRTYKLDNNDIILVSTPMHHSLAQRGVLLGLTLGATVVLMDVFSPKQYLELIQKAQVTFSFAVSSQLENIVDIIEKYTVKSIKKIVSSSYSIKPDIKNKLLNYFNIYECYGTSEIGCVTQLEPKDLDKHLESVGKPIDGIDIKIINPLQQGIGEIIVKSPWKFKKYYNMPQITSDSFLDSYFKTGDLGVLRDGYLYYMGRTKDIIKTGGISVYPIDIERVLKDINGIDEIAVVGIDDSYFGEAVIAIFKGDAKITDIVKIAKQELLSYQQPLFYDKVDVLPKNSLGKLQKFKLREKYNHLDLGKKLKGVL